MTRSRIVGMRRVLSLLAAAVFLSTAPPGVAAAQTRDEYSAIDSARALRDRGEYAAAAAQLRRYLEANPDDVIAARLLGETLYWMKDRAAARAVYERALSLHPDDQSLLLSYGRMLGETGDPGRARALLAPLVGRSQGRAEEQLGTLAYWEGDNTSARALFRKALRADPTLAAARRQLREIAAASAPWTSAQVDAAHDDQPLDRFGASLEAGWFPTPAGSIAVWGQGQRYATDSATLIVTAGELRAAYHAARARVETDAGYGALQRSDRVSPDWTGRLGIGFRMKPRLTFRLRAGREGYFYTRASLTTPLMTSTGTAMLALADEGGWTGEAALQHQSFPDSNAINTAYSWVLAPLVRNAGGSLRIGYSLTAQSAERSRFVLDNPSQPYPATDPRYSLDGHYMPYYTPMNLRSQSVLAAISLTPAPPVAIRLNGSYGVFAHEDVIAFQTVPAVGLRPASVARTTVPRSFSPWTGRAALEVGMPDGVQVAVVGAAFHTAFYTNASASLRFTYHFTTWARTRSDRH